MSAQVFILLYLYISLILQFFFGRPPHPPHRLPPVPPFSPPRRVQRQPNRPLAPLASTRRLPQRRQEQQQKLEKHRVSSPRCLNDGLYNRLDLRYISFFLFSFLSTNTFFFSGSIIDLLKKEHRGPKEKQRRILEEGRGFV